MIRTLRYFFLPLLLLSASCGDKPAPKKKMISRKQMEPLSVQMNVWDVKRQNDEIDQYVKNHNWTMEKTASGLRYMYMKKGNGELAKEGMHAKVFYRIYLLDGTLCYSSEKDGAKTFLIGQDYVESGLHEGLQLMHVGDRMRFILPSHLAHGLTGDQLKIPSLASVVYEVELLELKKQ